MLGVALVFLACFGVGWTAAARWLPDLASGRVGGMAFLAVCILLGATLGLVGLHVYTLIDELRHVPGGLGEPELFASVLRNLLWQAGTLLGLAGVLYMVSPAGEEDDVEPAAGG